MTPPLGRHRSAALVAALILSAGVGAGCAGLRSPSRPTAACPVAAIAADSIVTVQLRPRCCAYPGGEATLGLWVGLGQTVTLDADEGTLFVDRYLDGVQQFPNDPPWQQPIEVSIPGRWNVKVRGAERRGTVTVRVHADRPVPPPAAFCGTLRGEADRGEAFAFDVAPGQPVAIGIERTGNWAGAPHVDAVLVGPDRQSHPRSDLDTTHLTPGRWTLLVEAQSTSRRPVPFRLTVAGATFTPLGNEWPAGALSASPPAAAP